MFDMISKMLGDQPIYKKVLMFIGLVWSIRFAIKLIRGLNYFFVKSGVNLSQRYGVGSWVVITGSTDGLGKEFARQFAKLRFNIVLISRTQTKLDAVADEISKEFGVKTKTIACDFSTCHQPGFFDKVTDITKDLDISVLVNNVGIDSIERFDELSADYIEKTIVVNCWAMTFMMKALVKQMATRNRSSIINLSSMIGLYPAHHYNIYSASKAFVDMLTRCMSREYNNVDFLSVCPSEVSTPMTMNKPTDIWTIKTNQCVDWVFNDLGKGYIRTEGHWKHKGQSLLTGAMPPLFHYLWENFILNDMRKERNLPDARIY